MAEKKINFLIAGTQKGGTTSLGNYCNQHSKLFIPACKEVHFFDNEDIDWLNQSNVDKIYLSHYPVDPNSWLLGDATPIYSFWEPAMQRIWHHNPGIKIILCLRNPSIVPIHIGRWRPTAAGSIV